MWNVKILILQLINILCFIHSVYGYRIFDRNGAVTILALENENVDVQCKTDMPMNYCGFIHPSGKRYSFSGTDLSDGHCAVKIKASKKDSGQWSCHIGKTSIGVEIKQTINLRVVSKMAAIVPNVTVTHGKSVTLECATVKTLTPIRYCRFEPPKDSPFSISSAVNSENPILGKYYFPQNMSIDRGDCAVTIRKVSYDHVGQWSCGAGFDDGNEYTDTITLDVDGLYTMSTASTTGITFGVLGAIALLGVIGVAAWKRRRILGMPPHQPEQGIEIEELRGANSPRQTPPPSPQPVRHLPIVVVQSPSEVSERSNT